MSSYVIRGGAEGKAATLRDQPGIGILDRGLARRGRRARGDAVPRPRMRRRRRDARVARLVGPSGVVVGIDMDAVKIELAKQDARDQAVDHVEFRSGDAAALDARDEYDAEYAWLLLTHLAEPEATLQRMIAAVKPDGVVIVEDLDHSRSSRTRSVLRWIATSRSTTKSPGDEGAIRRSARNCRGMLRRAGLDDVQLRLTQPIFMAGPAKRINQLTLENVQEAILAEGVTTADEIDAIMTELEAFTEDPDTIVVFPRFFQVFGRRPG